MSTILRYVLVFLSNDNTQLFLSYKDKVMDVNQLLSIVLHKRERYLVKKSEGNGDSIRKQLINGLKTPV